MASKQKKLLKKQAKQAKKAASKPKKKPVIKPKHKKKWFTVLAPVEYNSVVVGESMAADADSLKNRIVKMNLMTVTRNMKKQNIIVKFRIKDVKGDKAETELVAYDMNLSYVKRLAKRSKEKIDDSFVTVTKDEVKIRVKPVLFTKSHTTNGVLTDLRKGAQEFIAKYAKDKTFTQFVSALNAGEIQREMKGALKKVYPVSIAEIRALIRV
ncbi:MAG: hypothetical protein ABIF40_02585 [archaeon]